MTNSLLLKIAKVLESFSTQNLVNFGNYGYVNLSEGMYTGNSLQILAVYIYIYTYIYIHIYIYIYIYGLKHMVQ